MNAADQRVMERQARSEAEKSTWPERYATVRDAIARGFVPAAYGNVQGWPLNTLDVGTTIWLPPTRFGYPPGGLSYPHHAGGPGAGARFHVWSHDRGTPDELRDRRVWMAGAPNAILDCLPYRSYGGLTLPEALDRCVVLGAHYRQHFIVPDWVDEHPRLLAREWREMIAAETIPVQPAQLDMFAPVARDPFSEVKEFIRGALAGYDDGEALQLTGTTRDIYAVERLLDQANWQRAKQGVPNPPPLIRGTSTFAERLEPEMEHETAGAPCNESCCEQRST